jgi:pimeloyl-ACP methyl ester carboxylesterase
MKTWLASVALVAMVLGVTGALYQLLSERRDLQLYPAPGELVDVGSHRLHLHCIGEGSPVVLLEAGWGNDVNHWSLVQPAVAEVTRVCAYDRAGLGWSDPGPHPRTAARVVQELVRLFPLAESALPAEKREVHEALRARTGAWAAVISEGMETCPMLDSLRATERLEPDIPVVVVAADRSAPGEQVFVDALQQMARELGAEEVTVAEESGHWVQLDRPEVVIDAILSQVGAIRAPADL